MAKTISQTRTDIESIDEQIHTLLMKRAALYVDAGKSFPAMQPDFEAADLRGVLGRHSGPMPATAISRIWREIITACSLIQSDLRVAAALTTEITPELRDMIRNYFGSVIPVQDISHPLAAISAVRENEYQFAVMPWPNDGTENPWWTMLDSDDPQKGLHVLAALPYDLLGGDVPTSRALVMGQNDFLPSGRDHTLLALALDDDISRARLHDRAASLDMRAVAIYSTRPRSPGGRYHHLLDIDGYVAGDDPRLREILDRLESPGGRSVRIGGYPV